LFGFARVAITSKGTDLRAKLLRACKPVFTGRHVLRRPTAPSAMAIIRRHPVHGLFLRVDPSRDGAFAAALHRLGTDPENRRRMGERSRARVLRESCIDVVAPRLLACMERAAVGGPHHG
jgi:hypothetical protein